MGHDVIDITPGLGQGGVGPPPSDFDPLEVSAWVSIVRASPRGCLLPIDRFALAILAKQLVLFRQLEREAGRHRVRSIELDGMRASVESWLREFFITDLRKLEGLF